MIILIQVDSILGIHINIILAQDNEVKFMLKIDVVQGIC